jgi:hypothetical protein
MQMVYAPLAVCRCFMQCCIHYTMVQQFSLIHAVLVLFALYLHPLDGWSGSIRKKFEYKS